MSPQKTNRKAARKPEPTAAQVYAARRGDIARLLDVLDMELAKHDAAASASPGDWGFAGNLGKVRGDLIETVALGDLIARHKAHAGADWAATTRQLVMLRQLCDHFAPRNLRDVHRELFCSHPRQLGSV